MCLDMDYLMSVFQFVKILDSVNSRHSPNLGSFKPIFFIFLNTLSSTGILISARPLVIVPEIPESVLFLKLFLLVHII